MRKINRIYHRISKQKSSLTIAVFNYRFYIFVLSLSVSLVSCGTINETQRSHIEALSLGSDTIIAVPSAIFNSLSTIRLERGLFYSASLVSPEAKERELRAIANSNIDDESLSAKIDVYVKSLNSYIRTLQSISHSNRQTNLGTQLRGMGRDIDSLVIRYNDLKIGEDLPEGFAKMGGRFAGYLAESYIGGRQTKFLKEYMAIGDSLVSICTSELKTLLQKGLLDDLIKNEEEGLKNNYLIYLQYMQRENIAPDMAASRRYIELIQDLESVQTIRTRCIRGLTTLAKAHNAIYISLQSKEIDTNTLWNELLELNSLAVKLADDLKKIR